MPVTTLDVGDLPFTIDNGMKVFQSRRRTGETNHRSRADISTSGVSTAARRGPLFRRDEGDRVRIVFDNHCRSRQEFTGTDSNFPSKWTAFPESARSR